jgi:predicted RNase H-like HicB family nuclease
VIYTYPAIFIYENQDISVTFPDIPDINTFGENISDALCMAKDALEAWLSYAEEHDAYIPVPTDPSAVTVSNVYPFAPDGPSAFTSMIYADTVEYRRKNDNRCVKKTLSIPAWLNARASAANINFSQLLQKAIKQELNLTDAS